MGGRAVDDPEYVQYAVCRMMGWDVETYQRQPSQFIRDILAFSNMEQFAAQQHQRDQEQRFAQRNQK